MSDWINAERYKEEQCRVVVLKENVILPRWYILSMWKVYGKKPASKLRPECLKEVVMVFSWGFCYGLYRIGKFWKELEGC